MIFYLGIHHPNWLQDTDVPLFVSRRWLAGRRTFPRAAGRWALDSGGFTELNKYGEWQTDAKQYAGEIRRFENEIGTLDWAAPQDWMCEPSVLEKTGRSVSEHQALTVANFLELRDLDPGLPVIPVLQGWEPDDYLRCWELYENCGICLGEEPTVGVGSVCRRQGNAEIVDLLRSLSGAGLRVHGFGVKTKALERCSGVLESSDSMAWSYDARVTHRKMPGHDGHGHCGNCLEYALWWRHNLLSKTRGVQ